MRRFANHTNSSTHNELIDKAFAKTRFLESKRICKLNNNRTAIKSGEPGHDPACKFDCIWECSTHNVNAASDEAGLDQCLDETSFSFMGCGPAGTELIDHQKNEPGLCKGGQTCVVSDVDRIRPRAHAHQHEKHDFPFGKKGPSEARLIMEELAKLCPMIPPLQRPRGLFSQKPHLTADDHFSGDEIMAWCAQEGFGLTMTCHRDRPPKGVPGKCFHKEKMSTQTDRTGAARWEVPVFATKKLNGATLQHTSFQSTSSCNFSSVNALNDMSLCARTKERGTGVHKRQWGIEMNEARELHSKTHGKIDTIDHCIENCDMSCRSMKCWHAGMNHAKKLAITVAFDMHKEWWKDNSMPTGALTQNRLLCFIASVKSWQFKCLNAHPKGTNAPAMNSCVTAPKHPRVSIHGCCLHVCFLPCLLQHCHQSQPNCFWRLGTAAAFVGSLGLSLTTLIQ